MTMSSPPRELVNLALVSKPSVERFRTDLLGYRFRFRRGACNLSLWYADSILECISVGQHSSKTMTYALKQIGRKVFVDRKESSLFRAWSSDGSLLLLTGIVSAGIPIRM